MSWFQSLTGALSGSTNTNAGNSAGNSSTGGTSGGNSSVPTTFDASGNPIGDSGSSAGNSAGTSSAPAPAPAPATKSVEELLFSPAPAPAPAANNNKPAEPNQKPTVNELAPGLTSQQLIQNLQSVNFMGAVPPEVLQSALSGDQNAFGQVMSSVAQMSAAIAVQQSIVAANAAMEKRFTEFDGSLTSKIGESKFADVLADPKFSNPFVRPLAENLITRLRANDSSITPDQIKQVLPRLIEHAMKQFPVGSDQGGNNAQMAALMQGNAGRTVPTEVKFDELFS